MKIMKRQFLILFFVLSAVLPRAKAQFVEVDWAQLSRDTLLPRYSTVLPLPDDAHLYKYTVAIEYPEFKEMSKAEVAHYRLHAMRDTLPAYPSVEAYLSTAAKKQMLDISFVPVVYSGGRFLRIESFKLAVDRVIDAQRTMSHIMARSNAQERYAQNSVLASGRWVKISVPSEGVYRITAAELARMGFKNPDKVRLYGYGGETLPETNIHLLPDDLDEVPLWREQGYVLFYANGTIGWNYEGGRFRHRQNVYSQGSCYFLTESDEAPLAFPRKELAASSKVYSTYPDYALYEKEEHSLCTYGRVLLDGYNYASGRTQSYKFELPGVMSDERATMELSFGSNATATSRVTASVNGVQAGSLSLQQISGTDVGRIANTTMTVSSLSANTTVTLTHSVPDATVSGHLDYIELNFVRALALRGAYTLFRGDAKDGDATFRIASATAATRVWDVTSPAATVEYAGTLDNGTLSVVAPATVTSRLVAVDVKAAFPSVKVVGEVKNQNLHAMEPVDMVIIVPSNGVFMQQAERLALAHRTMDNMRVAVVTAAQVFNEFSSGTPDATAFRRLMKMLYDRAATAQDAPKYLLLFGDGFADNRLITLPRYNPDNYLLTYQSENSTNAVRSYVLEDYYGFLDDNEGGSLLRDKVDIAVGRFPVQTLTDATAVVDKTIAYMQNKVPGAWQNVIVLMGDDGDKLIPNQHMKDAEAIADIFAANYPEYIIDRIYWDDYPMEVLATGNSYPLVTQAIYDRLNEGALIVNYSGHGSANVFSHELVWKASDMSALSSPRLPFWVTASCDITPFDMSDGSMGELAILNPKGGAIGLLTTTRTVLQSYNALINQQFMRLLMRPMDNGSMPAVGDAMRLAKCALISGNSDLSENKLQYVLIGDPALHLHIPQYKVVVERFNNEAADRQGKVSAGGVLSVEGYIATRDGAVATGYTGTVSPTLFDCIEDVYTRDNIGLGSFNYQAYRKPLSVGCDSVVNGRFSLTIPVPMDISYSNGRGMLNLYAVDTLGISAQGVYDNFIVGGTAESINNDGKGPEIRMYLNTPDFADGDEVNSTPCLFAELFDENGINTVGAGIGHDIVAMVDNDVKRTYSLNSVYKPIVGDYRGGTIVFPIEELSPGEHTLLLRAWDLYNNSSADTLRFRVVPDLAPDFVSVSVSPNPVRYGENAQFVLTHDRPSSALDVTVEVFNMQGQTVWRHSESVVSEGTTFTVSWNVTAGAGQPLPTGVYLYRATISDASGIERSKAQKMIILNNK